jgi:hypothetical protein
MTAQDQIIGALCAYRENRGGLVPGMQSVLNVLQNRAAARNTDVYTEAVRHLQFSSMTATGDPELTLWPSNVDPQWVQALSLTQQAAAGTLADITNGSTLYYAPKGIQTTATFTLPDGTVVPFPQGWNAAAVTYQATIANQIFMTE